MTQYDEEYYASSGAAPQTEHRRLDDALAALADVAEAPPADQIGPLTDAHTALRETLDSIGTV
jgi:hypothetical protein